MTTLTTTATTATTAMTATAATTATTATPMTTMTTTTLTTTATSMTSASVGKLVQAASRPNISSFICLDPFTLSWPQPLLNENVKYNGHPRLIYPTKIISLTSLIMSIIRATGFNKSRSADSGKALSSSWS